MHDFRLLPDCRHRNYLTNELSKYVYAERISVKYDKKSDIKIWYMPMMICYHSQNTFLFPKVNVQRDNSSKPCTADIYEEN